MSGADITASSDRLRKVVKWIADEQDAYPEKKRNQIILEAEIKFDLSPRECQFLQDKLMDKS